ncbi:MAG: hypothetical protein CME25_01055 [Gemmatimonadetes bacterium]|nr:hypothetical protein [Gemmatimonadota bacterium]|tara:strand:+ start:4010 stop:4795 length:786 start_codon:yes stop_codon:yes gene_type:complete
MPNGDVVIPADFAKRLKIQNAEARLDEALDVARKISEAGVPLLPNPDHAAIFVDPPHLVAGPLKEVGYVAGWDTRSYPSPVDGHDYINVPTGLPQESPARNQGWFDYVAVVHPVDSDAREHMLSQGYGNPFLHHMTWGIVPPAKGSRKDLEYASDLIPYAVLCRDIIGRAIGEEPGTLILALPETVVESQKFKERLPNWLGDLKEGEFQIEAMQGGGYLIQFFVRTGGRIEVALRVGTRQTFNPKSVHKISKDEISAVQSG